jgi:hypothetical protein
MPTSPQPFPAWSSGTKQYPYWSDLSPQFGGTASTITQAGAKPVFTVSPTGTTNGGGGIHK